MEIQILNPQLQFSCVLAMYLKNNPSKEPTRGGIKLVNANQKSHANRQSLSWKQNIEVVDKDVPLSLWPLLKIQARCHVNLLSFGSSIERSKVLSQGVGGVDLSLYVPSFLPLECSRKLKQNKA